MKDYYRILGVSAKADQHEIKAAYRKLVKIYHPDVVGDDPEKNRMMIEIQEAYEIIGDEKKRKEHDALRNRKRDIESRPERPVQNIQKGRNLSREEMFFNFFGFRPGKGPEDYKNNKNDKDPVYMKPEQMFASFFKNIR